jgi:hypothetical protein
LFARAPLHCSSAAEQVAPVAGRARAHREQASGVVPRQFARQLATKQSKKFKRQTEHGALSVVLVLRHESAHEREPPH